VVGTVVVVVGTVVVVVVAGGIVVVVVAGGTVFMVAGTPAGRLGATEVHRELLDRPERGCAEAGRTPVATAAQPTRQARTRTDVLP